jgi:tetratricopeptide (TPR) repeat protein
MRLEQARRLVGACDAVDATMVAERGYVWVRERLRPAVALLKGADPALAARGLNVLATMAERNEGYRAALAFLEDSLACDPAYVLSWFDVGYVNQELGKREEARRAYERALELEPLHRQATAMLAVLDDPAEPAAPVEAADALAEFDPERALAVAGSPYWRACAHGALGDATAALLEWQALARSEGPVRISPAAWYYLADDLFDDPDFWDAMVAMSPRFVNSTGAMHPSLVEAVRTDEDDPERLDARVLGLMARFHRARSRGDDGERRALAKAWPTWMEVADGF